MKKGRLDVFKKALLEIKNRIVNSGIINSGEDLKISPEDLSDETDLASNVINQQVSFNIRHREIQKLKEIESALQRIEDNTYGLCIECDDEIGEKRLLNQPWTRLCIVHAEEKERESQRYAR